MSINKVVNYLLRAKSNYTSAYQSEGLIGVYNRLVKFFHRRIEFINRENVQTRYEKWYKSQELHSEEILKNRSKYIQDIKFLIVLKSDLRNLEIIKNTILNQTYTNYEILIVNCVRDVSPRIFDYLLYINDEFLISSNLLYELARNIQKQKPDIIYIDHDHICGKKRHSPIFKPDFAYEMFLSIDYVSSPVIVSAKLFFESRYHLTSDNLFNFEIILLNLRRDITISHIPQILIHKITDSISNEIYPQFISDKPLINIEREKAVKNFINSNMIDATVEEGLLPYALRIKYNLLSNPKVSIIIPTKNRMDLVKTCIESVIYRSNYTNYEIILIDNNSDDYKSLEYFDSLKNNSKIKVYKYNYPFNFSAINNFAVNQASGEHIIFLNNDTEVISNNWIESMLEFSQKETIGCVGAKLLYPNTNIQHAGVIIGLGNLAGHSHRFVKFNELGYLASPWIVREYSAVTAACIMIKKSTFLKVRGFNEEYLPVAYNDIDLCLNCRELGLENIYTPYSQLFHYESVSRKTDDTPEKIARSNMETRYFFNKWKSYIKFDKYYSIHLTKEYEDYRL